MMDVEHVSGVIAFDSVPLFLNGLRAAIVDTPGMRWLGGTDSRTGAIALCRWWRPEIVLLDWSQDPDGSFQRTLKSRYGVRVVVALVEHSPMVTSEAIAAYRAGADAVVSRQANRTTLVNAITSARAGRMYIDKNLLGLTSSCNRRSPANRNAVTQRERQVLHLLAFGLRSAEVGVFLEVSLDTVRTYVRRVVGKLGARNRSQAVALAFRCGLLDGQAPVRPPAS